MKNVLLKSAVLAISAMLLTSCAVGSDSEIREVGFYEVESEDSQAILQEFRIILLDSKNNFLDGEFSEYSTATNVETGVTEKVKKLYNYRYPFEQISIFEKDNKTYKSNDTQNLYIMLLENMLDRDLDNNVPVRVSKENNEDGSVNYIFQTKDEYAGDVQTWQITAKDGIAISGLYKRLSIKIDYSFNYNLTAEEKALWN